MTKIKPDDQHPTQAAWPKMSHHQFEILASRENVVRSLTTAEGLSGWWTTNVRADQPAIGSLVNITFRGAFNPQMRITELDPPAWGGRVPADTRRGGRPQPSASSSTKRAMARWFDSGTG